MATAQTAKNGKTATRPGAVAQQAAEAQKGKGKAAADPMSKARQAAAAPDTTKPAVDPLTGKSKDEGKKKKVEYKLPVVAEAAKSLTIGPMVIQNLAKANEEDAEAEALKQSSGKRKYESIAQMTLALVKAIKADDGIDAEAVFADDQKRITKLNEQLGIALGVREIVTVGKGAAATQKTQYSKAVAKYFPQPGEEKDTPEYKVKNTVRTNYVAMLKRCTRAALGIVEADMKAEYDKSANTLRISGPAVKTQFGQPSVLLNERQTVENPNKKGDAIELKEKPSFTAIADIAARERGKSLVRTSNTRGRTQPAGTAATQAGQSAANTEQALEMLCKSMVAAVEKLPKKLTAKQVAALESVQSAVEKKLDERE